MRHSIVFLAAAGAIALAGMSSLSCSSGSSGGTGGGSGGGSAGGGSAGAGGGSAGGAVEMADADAGLCTSAMLATCTSYDDRTAADAGRTVEFGTTNPSAAVPQCMKVKSGQTVTLNAGAFHPVVQDCGPVNGKITAPDSAMTPIRFGATGDYMYHCSIHQFPGFIKVVP
jgi:plastocyanin